MVDGVIFDAFGTLLEIRNRQSPYRRLLRLGSQQGRVASPDDIRWIMTNACGLQEAADFFGIKLSSAQLAELQSSLDVEIQSITPFEDALPAIELLRNRKVRIGVCSNLGGPYCSVVRNLLPGLDGYALSAEVGLMKPDAAMYQHICTQLDVVPSREPGLNGSQVMMIGDSRRCDAEGPRAAGLEGYHLDRSGAGRFSNLLEFVAGINLSKA
ncbi:HAD family hydrolase [Pseudomonas sp. B26(2017)]|uniref:HAD family hydrolase n=1 Tax=Pseudomonas sp. B26(2017) TaxID=1981732 RepID=UPI000A1DEF4F|nr:HAD family hydrolase [Pseudomonas sp. B26(2017)]